MTMTRSRVAEVELDQNKLTSAEEIERQIVEGLAEEGPLDEERLFVMQFYAKQFAEQHNEIVAWRARTFQARKALTQLIEFITNDAEEQHCLVEIANMLALKKKIDAGESSIIERDPAFPLDASAVLQMLFFSTIRLLDSNKSRYAPYVLNAVNYIEAAIDDVEDDDVEDE